MKRIYLDYAATTPVHSEVLAEIQPYWKQNFGNPSSVHYYGRKVKQGMEKARKQVADLIGAHAEEIIFTSGATEADNSAIFGVARAKKEKGRHIITSKIEHHAVLDSCQALEKEGFTVTYLDVDHTGMVSVRDLKKALRPDTILVSIMHANNEIGTIQPIREIGELLKKRKICFHTDAVQSVGQIDVHVDQLNVDLLSLSGHKMYGIKGAGALYVRSGTVWQKMMYGGAQENSLRSGTENIPGIIALGKAAEIAQREGKKRQKYVTALRDLLITEIEQRIPFVQLNGHRHKRLPGNVNFCFSYLEGATLLLCLDAEGIACSAGSACTAGDAEISHVLKALNIDPALAKGALRMTLGRKNTKKDLERVLAVLEKQVQELRNVCNTYLEGKDKSHNSFGTKITRSPITAV